MPTIEKMTVALTSEIRGDARRAVAAGEYASADEAIQAAVREWQERPQVPHALSRE